MIKMANGDVYAPVHEFGNGRAIIRDDAFIVVGETVVPGLWEVSDCRPEEQAVLDALIAEYIASAQKVVVYRDDRDIIEAPGT